jgi:hypothetical protein
MLGSRSADHRAPESRTGAPAPDEEAKRAPRGWQDAACLPGRRGCAGAGAGAGAGRDPLETVVYEAEHEAEGEAEEDVEVGHDDRDDLG